MNQFASESQFQYNDDLVDIESMKRNYFRSQQYA